MSLVVHSVSSSHPKVFVSCYAPDVHHSFIRELSAKVMNKRITMLLDYSPKQSGSIGPDILKGIRESRISIVVFSRNYPSSKWCLDVLLEILKCQESLGLIVMPVYYRVNPTDVRKQTGVFGEVFERTCASAENLSQNWSQALIEVSNLLGWDLHNWENKAAMLVSIASYFSNKLYTANSKDFEHIVGLTAHLEKMKTLLQLDNEDEAMIVGICGFAGIGKTTIARALHRLLLDRFHLNCFMENIRGSYNGGLDEYDLKLRLQEQLLSKLINTNDYLGPREESLCNKKVLIILDDVDDLTQLEALAKERNRFGPGSRIVVIREDPELLSLHGIQDIYRMELPSSEEALAIFCGYAFGQSYPLDGFEELAEIIVDLCNNLPLSLRMVGSFLRGKKEEQWDKVMRRLEEIDDHQDIEQVLRDVYQQSSSKKQIRKRKSQCFTGMAILVVMNLVTEIASVVSDQLHSNRKPYFTRISLFMSILSVVFSIIDLSCKVREQKACFRCKWPIPWFYYPSRGYKRIFGNYTDTVLLFCVVGGLIVSTVNYRFVETGRDGPVKSSIWPLFFAIGMVVSKFMEKPISSNKADPKPYRSMV